MKRLVIPLAAVSLCSCVMNTVMHTTNEFAAPGASVTILLVRPDVQLGSLTASGLVEPRADWTEQAAAHVERHVRDQLDAKDHSLVVMERDQALAGRELQLVRLHEAVGNTIWTFKQTSISLPTKKDTFDWSLGPGVQVLRDGYSADYALFLHAQGQYATGGRIATAIVGAYFGAIVSTGGQVGFASLVDLTTGDIIWFNVASASDTHDLREDAGAAGMVRVLLDEIPL